MAQCVFCQLPFQSPHRKRSKEHAYPKWLEKYLPSHQAREKMTMHAGAAAERAGEQQSYRWMPIGTYEQTVKAVCVPCNTGWMEQVIETDARPTLIELFEGGKPDLTYKAQRSLAAWGWKTAAMIMLLADEPSRAVSETEYRWFHERKTPPFRSLVWIGSYEGDSLREAWQPWTTTAVLTEAPVPDGVTHNTYSVWFTVGPIIFLIFGTSTDFMVPLGPRERLIDSVRRIWPVGPCDKFSWPPGPGVGDVVLKELRQAFVDLGPGQRLLARGYTTDLWGPLT